MIEMDFEKAIESLKLILGIDAWTENQVILDQPIPVDAETRIDRLDVSEIKAAVSGINEASSRSGCTLNWTNKCELMLISNSSGPRGVFIRELPEIASSDENGIKYSIGEPSLPYCLNFLSALLEESRQPVMLQSARRRLRERRYALSMPDSGRRDGLPVTAAEVIGSALPLLTLKVESVRPRNDYHELAEAFLFQLAYSYDMSYRTAYNLDHLTDRGRVRRRGRPADAGMDAPRMTYTSDLVHHYQLAVSAESPMLKYLSYYHIAEHFFEKVFNDDFVDQVRKKIADPSFSLKRSKDIQGIIKLVTTTQRKVRDEGGVDEQKALALVLERYVDLPRLVGDVKAHDNSLIEHYRTASPSFTENLPVNLEGEKDSEIITALAKRIYQTRNSLVHAKDGSRPKYFPFVNDAELAKEIPLIRFCAEQVIIEHGKVI
ncbi:hypothetical protein ABZ611_14790 [Streptomyces sp. NPDC007861]|uniref:hypothetical protein n=1 Tax=Streptomyces sp. NPDC007861 TaxID=3154893 RepID=UPI0033C83C8F